MKLAKNLLDKMKEESIPSPKVVQIEALVEVAEEVRFEVKSMEQYWIGIFSTITPLLQKRGYS